ncbi:MAG: hypothetical protein ACT4QG_19010 [Sporichthyaceae bacterium]
MAAPIRSTLCALLACGSLSLALPAAAAPKDFYERTCTHEVGGVPLRVNLVVQFNEANSADITRVSVRSTDKGESGEFKSASAQLTGVSIRVVGKPGSAEVNKRGKTSPYAADLDPTGTGKDAFSVTTVVSWKLPKKQTGEITCLYLNG